MNNINQFKHILKIYENKINKIITWEFIPLQLKQSWVRHQRKFENIIKRINWVTIFRLHTYLKVLLIIPKHQMLKKNLMYLKVEAFLIILHVLFVLLLFYLVLTQLAATLCFSLFCQKKNTNEISWYIHFFASLCFWVFLSFEYYAQEVKTVKVRTIHSLCCSVLFIWTTW